MLERDQLNTRLVAEIIRAQFPELLPAGVIFLGEGYDSSAFEVNAEWVFRFPKRADVERQLLTETRILPVLSEHAPVPVPAFCFHGQPSADFPRHFAGYRKLRGVPAIQLDPARLPFLKLAPTLARFLSWLHSFPISEAARLGVGDQEIGSLIEEIRMEALTDFESVNKVAPGAPLEEWYAYLKEGPGMIARWPSTPALLHNDLAAEHILFDSTTQAVTGIIDWSDIAVGDRSVDFAGVFHWGGEAFINAVLATYDGPIDDCVAPRARFIAACRGVGDVTFGLETDRREYIAAGIRALELAVGA